MCGGMPCHSQASSPTHSHSFCFFSPATSVLARKWLGNFPPVAAPPVEGKREKDMEKMIRGCICLFREERVLYLWAYTSHAAKKLFSSLIHNFLNNAQVSLLKDWSCHISRLLGVNERKEGVSSWSFSWSVMMPWLGAISSGVCRNYSHSSWTVIYPHGVIHSSMKRNCQALQQL